MDAERAAVMLSGWIEEGKRLQTVACAQWHVALPESLPENEHPLIALVLAEHWVNFRLWHVEDEARMRDVDDSVIADCKRRIDRLNQMRNDLIEDVDQWICRFLEPVLPADAPHRFNTETVGSALDRLSIMALKAYHMREQAERREAGEAHTTACRAKAETLDEQRADLTRSVLELVEEYAAGHKRPKISFQFKMYNDPALNPKLYGAS